MKTLYRTSMFLVIFTMAFFLFIPASQSALIYDNSPPNSYSAESLPRNVIFAEDFSLDASATISEIWFWGIDFGFEGNPLNIGWRIYENSSGLPGSIINEGTSVASSTFDHDSGLGTSYLLKLSISSVSLDAGTYWLGLHDGSFDQTEGYSRISWEGTFTTSNYGLASQSYSGGWGDWSAGSEDLAFQLHSVPIPSAGLLLFSGITGLFFVRRKSKGRTIDD